MITALLIVTISSNVVLALGMVGALSIVRFRTAIKDPLDIVFLFWSLSTGMIVGARLYAVAVVATIIIALVFFLMLKVFLLRPLARACADGEPGAQRPQAGVSVCAAV